MSLKVFTIHIVLFPQSHTMEPMIITPEMNSTLKIADVQAHDLPLQHNFLSYLFGLLITTYIVWQYFLRTGVTESACSEPPMLPYWIPGKAKPTVTT